MDTYVQLIRTHYGGCEIEPEVPRGLKQTLSYLRKAFQKLEELQPMRHAVLPMLQKVTDLSERRHLIVHGAAVGHFNESGISLERLRGAKSTYVKDKQTVSIAEIYAIGHEAAPLTAELAGIGFFMKAPFPGSVFEDSIS